MKKSDVQKISQQLKALAKLETKTAEVNFELGGSNDECWQAAHEGFGKAKAYSQAATILDKLCQPK